MFLILSFYVSLSNDCIILKTDTTNGAKTSSVLEKYLLRVAEPFCTSLLAIVP